MASSSSHMHKYQKSVGFLDVGDVILNHGLRVPFLCYKESRFEEDLKQSANDVGCFHIQLGS